jgi:hypothetical protein
MDLWLTAYALSFRSVRGIFPVCAKPSFRFVRKAFPVRANRPLRNSLRTFWLCQFSPCLNNHSYRRPVLLLPDSYTQGERIPRGRGTPEGRSRKRSARVRSLFRNRRPPSEADKAPVGRNSDSSSTAVVVRTGSQTRKRPGEELCEGGMFIYCWHGREPGGRGPGQRLVTGIEVGSGNLGYLSQRAEETGRGETIPGISNGSGELAARRDGCSSAGKRGGSGQKCPAPNE